MSKTSKIERAELYKEQATQLLLSKFISGEISRLDPVFDPKLGYRYPSIEAVVGEPSATDKFLNNLYEAGILKREIYDKIVYCPQCGAANVSIRYCCPHCKSFDIKKSALIEHVKCGYIDVEERFLRGDKLVCPRCNEELIRPDVDYRRAGIWCNCNECGKSFDIPVPSHFCRECHANFMFEDAVYKNVYSYILSDEAGKEASLGLVVVAPIREFLQKTQFEVESPGLLKGKSGASHMFDVAAYRGEEGSKYVTVIDVATSTEEKVSEQPVIAMFAKIYDVEPDRAYLIAIPKISEDGKRMAALYNIELIEAKDHNEAVKALEASVLKKTSSKRGAS